MEKKEQVIKDRLQKLIERMGKLGYNDHMIRLAKERVSELQQRGVNCVDRFIQKLLDSVGGKEAYLDILTEGRFAIILARLKFSKIQIEYCERGPDIIANWNRNLVYFEVTRSRPSGDEWAAQPDEAFVLSTDRAENIISIIQKKRRQLQGGQTNIVVIWSDTRDLLLPTFEEACEYIKEEIEQNPGTYNDLSAILFTEGEESYRITLKKFYLFNNEKARKPLKPSLIKKLGVLLERDKVELQVELQRENEELLAALKSLR